MKIKEGAQVRVAPKNESKLLLLGAHLNNSKTNWINKQSAKPNVISNEYLNIKDVFLLNFIFCRKLHIGILQFLINLVIPIISSFVSSGRVWINFDVMSHVNTFWIFVFPSGYPPIFVGYSRNTFINDASLKLGYHAILILTMDLWTFHNFHNKSILI